MKLFEGGILDKITSDEYEKMFQSTLQHAVDKKKIDKKAEAAAEDDDEVGVGDDEESKNVESNLVNGNGNSKAKTSSEKELTALSLQMLQGAFYLVLIGYMLAFLALLLEIGCRRTNVTVSGIKLNGRMAILHISDRLRTFRMRINRSRFS